MAAAISAGPPKAAMMHTVPPRSSGPIPTLGAAASHSSSLRQATDTVNIAMLPAMAVLGSPSSPAVITALGSMTSSAARTQSEVSTLSGTGIMVAMKSCCTVSSSRHPTSRACSSFSGDLQGLLRTSLNYWQGRSLVFPPIKSPMLVRASQSRLVLLSRVSCTFKRMSQSAINLG